MHVRLCLRLSYPLLPLFPLSRARALRVQAKAPAKKEAPAKKKGGDDLFDLIDTVAKGQGPAKTVVKKDKVRHCICVFMRDIAFVREGETHRASVASAVLMCVQAEPQSQTRRTRSLNSKL